MNKTVLPATLIKKEARVLPHVCKEPMRCPLGVPFLPLCEDALKLPVQLTLLDQPHPRRGLVHPERKGLEHSQCIHEVQILRWPACEASGEIPVLDQRLHVALVELDPPLRQGYPLSLHERQDGQE